MSGNSRDRRRRRRAILRRFNRDVLAMMKMTKAMRDLGLSFAEVASALNAFRNPVLSNQTQ